MKSLCEICKKGVEKNMAKIVPIVSNPEYICKKCARVANVEGRLCKPKKLSKRK